MSLSDHYTREFETLWNLYPKHPIGRSNKKLAFTAFCNAKRALKFDQSDLDFIARDSASCCFSAFALVDRPRTRETPLGDVLFEPRPCPR